MACEDGDFDRRALPWPGSVNHWSQALADNDRWLVLSGAPEKVKSSQSNLPRRLYDCIIPIPESGHLDCRVYVWHVNTCDFSIRIATIIRLSDQVDAPATFLNHRWKRHFALRDDPTGIG